MKVEEKAQTTEEARLKDKKHKRAWMKVEEEFLLVLEARHKSEEEGAFMDES